tara:strand:+ start:6024 stop:6191 length:168 start_codon:yes stop_codon:yes gene_type:complete
MGLLSLEDLKRLIPHEIDLEVKRAEYHIEKCRQTGNTVRAKELREFIKKARSIYS